MLPLVVYGRPKACRRKHGTEYIHCLARRAMEHPAEREIIPPPLCRFGKSVIFVTHTLYAVIYARLLERERQGRYRVGEVKNVSNKEYCPNARCNASKILSYKFRHHTPNHSEIERDECDTCHAACEKHHRADLVQRERHEKNKKSEDCGKKNTELEREVQVAAAEPLVRNKEYCENGDGYPACAHRCAFAVKC